MGLRPGSQSPDCLIKSQIGSAYDNVKEVADNLDDIVLVADNMPFIRNNVFNYVQENKPIDEDMPLGSRWYKPSTNQVFAYYFSDVNPVGIWTETNNGY